MNNKELNNNNINKITKKFSFDEVKYQFVAAFCGNFFFNFYSEDFTQIFKFKLFLLHYNNESILF